MPAARLLRILNELSARSSPEGEPARLCAVSADVAGMDGAGILLMTADGPQGSVCTSNDVSRTLDELQYTLVEGPSLDAHHLGRPALEPDLLAPGVPRWVAFTPAAAATGARAVFAFPLVVGSVRLGALGLYREEPGPLTTEQYADCLVLAGVAAQFVLNVQAQAPPGMLGAALEKGASSHYVVHQAAGMVSAQCKISVGDAMVRLRAHAFSNGRLITDVARDVVDRILRFDAELPTGDSAP
jgi:hypothetical protein